MKTKKTQARVLVALLALVMIVLGAGCSSSKKLSGTSKKGMTLRYLFPDQQFLNYHTSSAIKQILDINGQDFTVDIGLKTSFSLKLKEKTKTNNFLKVKIDSMEIFVNSPQGELKPDMDQVNGKGFDMVLSTLGTGLDVSGAEAIQYEMGPGVKRNVAMTFKYLFPKLPESSLKVGDTWSMVDTISDKYETEEVLMVIENNYTLAGFETIMGIECARIISVYTGTRTGKATQQGVEMVSEGTIEGTGTYYFAYSEGYLVKDVGNSTIDATLVVYGPEERSIPMKYEMNMGTELVR